MRKWLHRALKGASLTTALFVFQACYGTPPGLPEEFQTVDETELVEEELLEENVQEGVEEVVGEEQAE